MQLSDVAKYKIHTPMPQEEDEVEDMFERSRVNRRLGVVEGQLDLTTQKLKESQKSLEVRTLATAHLHPLPPFICGSIILHSPSVLVHPVCSIYCPNVPIALPSTG